VRQVIFDDESCGQLTWTLPSVAVDALKELSPKVQADVMEIMKKSMMVQVGILTDVMLSGDELLNTTELLTEGMQRLCNIMSIDDDHS